ncbi:STAS domain-containing protein [Salininema proteolyticum]|uniref:Anti-sigma factor antagonist n=1 Tax=Salininema proteolyticum TaxID=1607685 RepID=A0ABV8U1U4_9ACTN
MDAQRLDAKTVVRDEAETVVAVSGELDLQTKDILKDEVETALSGGTHRLVLDLEGVTFCDSTGLGTLVVLNRTATKARAVMILTGVGDFLRRLLNVTGTSDHFIIRNK